jgi:large subunit ribosomal protein L21
MYAVISTGGKQYRVQPGETLQIEKLESQGSVTFDQVLMLADDDQIKIGQPTVVGAKVSAEILGEGRGEKLLVYKYRRRKGYRRKNGHRQPFTMIKITDISG